jgi:hypothetical protein
MMQGRARHEPKCPIIGDKCSAAMTRADGEVLKYAYDRGGLVQAAHGERPATRHEAAQAETYLGKLLYDEFGQRVHQRVGNGVVTRYAYEPLTRRLS